mmetsp:Transcript_24479/g.56799  ORF Transcript_24479/g.56799 Transcript_24479/m.56799 type:complete len:264 (+) Transcript_24479:1598-2389(+)
MRLWDVETGVSSPSLASRSVVGFDLAFTIGLDCGELLSQSSHWSPRAQLKSAAPQQAASVGERRRPMGSEAVPVPAPLRLSVWSRAAPAETTERPTIGSSTGCRLWIGSAVVLRLWIGSAAVLLRLGMGSAVLLRARIGKAREADAESALAAASARAAGSLTTASKALRLLIGRRKALPLLAGLIVAVASLLLTGRAGGESTLPVLAATLHGVVDKSAVTKLGRQDTVIVLACSQEEALLLLFEPVRMTLRPAAWTLTASGLR